MTKFLLLPILFITLFPFSANAQEQSEPTTTDSSARVENVLEEKLEPTEEAYQVIEVKIISENDYQNQTYTIDSREGYTAGLRYPVKPGQEVKVSLVGMPDGSVTAFLTDVVRLNPLMWLVILFIVITLLVGLLRGFTSLVGLGLIMLVLFGFIIPNLLAGRDPILFTIIGAAVIMLISVFGTHGLRRESAAAFLGTLAGLILTGVLAKIFVPLTGLTGLANHDATRLQLEAGLQLDMQGILLAAIIIGALGVLDDVTVTQSETVFELKKTDSSLGPAKLAKKALRIGRHHIASVINTLVLAYTGASLPLLLLFFTVDVTTIDFINSELVAEEIVRTLVGTIGLIITVPLATWIAAFYATRIKQPNK